MRDRRALVAMGKEVYRESIEDRVGGLAAEVAFFGVLSLFPGLLIVAAGLGSLEGLVGSRLAASTERGLLRFLDLILTDRAGGAVDAVARLFERESNGLLTVASLVALYLLARSFATILRALNLAYDIRESRPWWKVRLWSMGLALGTAIIGTVVLAMVVVGPLLGRGREVASALGMEGSFGFLWRWARWPVIVALMVVWATTLFYVGPNRRKERWRRDLPGALVTTLLWMIVSVSLSLYLRLAAGANPVFGVLGGGLILLVWLYLLSLALLIGGEVNSVLARHRDQPVGGGE